MVKIIRTRLPLLLNKKTRSQTSCQKNSKRLRWKKKKKSRRTRRRSLWVSWVFSSWKSKRRCRFSRQQYPLLKMTRSRSLNSKFCPSTNSPSSPRRNNGSIRDESGPSNNPLPLSEGTNLPSHPKLISSSASSKSLGRWMQQPVMTRCSRHPVYLQRPVDLALKRSSSLKWWQMD